MLAMILACQKSVPTQRLVVGGHTVRLVVPEGWERIDYGQRQVFRQLEERIVLVDFGPVAGEGYVREIDAVRDLWKSGQRPDARVRLDALQLLPFSFGNRAEYLRVHALLVHAQQVIDQGPETECEWRLTTLADTIAALPDPPLEAFVEYALDRLGPDRRREILPPEPTRIGEREALVVDTWDRLSHTQRRRHTLILNGGRLLVVAIEQGMLESTPPAYAALVQSLEFPPEDSSLHAAR
jgi:hypothetical protein